VLISSRCVKAWRKSPSCLPAIGSYSSTSKARRLRSEETLVQALGVLDAPLAARARSWELSVDAAEDDRGVVAAEAERV
jgi:hypothetical protein